MSLQRSELAVPATSPRFLEKAARCAADSVFIDLEDAVIPAYKREARAMAIQALNTLDWGNRIVSVRVNGLDTEWGCRDIIEIAESCPRLDRVLLPKCESAAHVKAVELMLNGIERGLQRAQPFALELLIETAAGLANVEAIAACRGRVRTIVFGAGDYQLDMRIFNRRVGAPSPDYAVLTDGGDGPQQRHWNDPWHAAMSRIANACRANGLLPVDGPFTSIEDPDGFHSAALRASALGFEGKWCIHPSQIEAANTVFAPSMAQLDWARDVLDALEKAAVDGKGAVRDKHGDMIDAAHGKMARAVLARAACIPGREPWVR